MPLRCAEWAGLAIGSSAALAGLAVALHWRAGVRLRAHVHALAGLLRRDSARGVAALARELRDGVGALREAQGALEELAVTVAGPDIPGAPATAPTREPRP